LQELRIRDFALVPEALIPFAPGLNAITGESGAGGDMRQARKWLEDDNIHK
jgi:DNA repair ATPase RecN